MVLTVRARQAERCALCHDALEGQHFTCSGCGTRVHASCRKELGRACPSLGCRGEPRRERREPRRYRFVDASEMFAETAARSRRASFLSGYVVGLVFSLFCIGLIVFGCLH
jgi:hypothetical protein